MISEKAQLAMNLVVSVNVLRVFLIIIKLSILCTLSEETFTLIDILGQAS